MTDILALNQLEAKGYLAAHKVCVDYLAETKRKKLVADWLRLSRTKTLINNLVLALDLPKRDLVCSFKGYPVQGTWIHPQLRDSFYVWLYGHPSSSPNNVYLIRAEGTNLYKVGIAKDVNARLAALKRASPLKLNLIYCRPVQSARTTEEAIHRALSDYHSHSEWFNCPTKTMNKVFNQYCPEALAT